MLCSDTSSVAKQTSLMPRSLSANHRRPRCEKKRFMVEETADSTTAHSSKGSSTRRLWLVRHGLTEWNAQQRFCGHRDIPLSQQGRGQAHWLAERLQEEMISAIYTSDLVRARETAEII